MLHKSKSMYKYKKYNITFKMDIETEWCCIALCCKYKKEHNYFILVPLY